jgi:hypothetical protein
MENAAFTRDRLRSVMPRLQQHFREVSSQEEYAGWLVDYEQIKIKRDAAAAELRTIYPEFASKLVDLLLRIEVVDREVVRVRSAKPFDAKEANGDGRWLVETELAARGLDSFGVHDHRILKDLQLPSFSEPTKLAWPPHRPIDPAWSRCFVIRVQTGRANGTEVQHSRPGSPTVNDYLDRFLCWNRTEGGTFLMFPIFFEGILRAL